jgi:hypothetical protein
MTQKTMKNDENLMKKLGVKNDLKMGAKNFTKIGFIIATHWSTFQTNLFATHWI